MRFESGEVDRGDVWLDWRADGRPAFVPRSN
jgi:hypothetical protein